MLPPTPNRMYNPGADGKMNRHATSAERKTQTPATLRSEREQDPYHPPTWGDPGSHLQRLYQALKEPPGRQYDQHQVNVRLVSIRTRLRPTDRDA